LCLDYLLHLRRASLLLSKEFMRIKKQTDLLSAKLDVEKKAITEPPELILELKHCELDTVVSSTES